MMLRIEKWGTAGKDDRLATRGRRARNSQRSREFGLVYSSSNNSESLCDSLIVDWRIEYPITKHYSGFNVKSMIQKNPSGLARAFCAKRRHQRAAVRFSVHLRVLTAERTGVCPGFNFCTTQFKFLSTLRTGHHDGPAMFVRRIARGFRPGFCHHLPGLSPEYILSDLDTDADRKAQKGPQLKVTKALLEHNHRVI